MCLNADKCSVMLTFNAAPRFAAFFASIRRQLASREKVSRKKHVATIRRAANTTGKRKRIVRRIRASRRFPDIYTYCTAFLLVTLETISPQKIIRLHFYLNFFY